MEQTTKKHRVVDIEDLHLMEHNLADCAEEVAMKLQNYYARNKRDLPWRRTVASEQQNAYRVWVSEVMLQQTQVSTVIPYFEKFMTQWPTIHELAKANEDEMMKMWSGLGYYRRASFLLTAVKDVVNNRNGIIPSTATELQKLKGVGPYTAGAIASIAFQQRAPIVDGNVVRLLSRLRGLGGNQAAAEHTKFVWKLSSLIVSQAEIPGDVNQALMELGATICTKTAPKCGECPIADHCLGKDDVIPWKHEPNNCFFCEENPEGILGPTRFPFKKKKAKKKQMRSVMICFEIGESSVLLTKRDEEGLLKGLREFPTISWLEGEERKVEDCQRDLLKRCFSSHAGPIEFVQVGTFKHLFTHIEETVSLFGCRVQRGAVAEGVDLVEKASLGKNGEAKSTLKGWKLMMKKK